MKTIRRNAHRKIAAIALTIVKVRMYDQSTGEMVESTTEAALWNLAEYNFAKLYDNEDGKYTVHVHSNKFFYLYTQAHLNAAQAEQAQRNAARAQRPAIATPTREQRNAATIARTTSIHDLDKPAIASFAPGTKVLWRDDQSECGTVMEDGDPVVVVETIDGPQGIMAGRLIADEPTVTVTRTRMAIGDQISQACTALGIKLGHGWNKGTATFLVNGRDYTASELADLVLVGGFAANFGGNTVNVNWNCPLVPGRTQENLAGRALMITRELQARMGTATARELEEVAQSLMDMLHGWAIEDAPAPRVDFPSGAAEPDESVTHVKCVRTGTVFMRLGTWWINRTTEQRTTWYAMNLVDPMSEGFQRHATKSVRRTEM